MKAKCLYCSELVGGEGTKPKLYCSDRCRKAYKRRGEQTDRLSKRTEQTDKVKGGVCWCCGAEIDKRTVCCQECAWSGKAKAERAGAYPPLLDDRTPSKMEADLSTLVLTGGYQLTAFEREHYKPADQLSKGEFNPVSLPGSPDYSGLCPSSPQIEPGGH